VTAKEADREAKLAERERLRGHIPESIEHLVRSRELKAGIPLLKESEKDPAFQIASAISGAEVFRAIKAATEATAQALQQGGNPFLNK
jgi:hypothetical protein